MKQQSIETSSSLSYIRALSAALILGVCSVIYLTYIPKAAVAVHSGVVLAVAGAIYAGFGLVEGSNNAVILEAISGLFFGSIATIGTIYSPQILGIGFLLHAVWDCLHHWKVVKTEINPWYPSFCAIYDFIVGIYLLVIYFS